MFYAFHFWPHLLPPSLSAQPPTTQKKYRNIKKRCARGMGSGFSCRHPPTYTFATKSHVYCRNWFAFRRNDNVDSRVYYCRSWFVVIGGSVHKPRPSGKTAVYRNIPLQMHRRVHGRIRHDAPLGSRSNWHRSACPRHPPRNVRLYFMFKHFMFCLQITCF